MAGWIQTVWKVGVLAGIPQKKGVIGHCLPFLSILHMKMTFLLTPCTSSSGSDTVWNKVILISCQVVTFFLYPSTSYSHWTVATGIHDRGHIYTNQVHRVRNVIVHEHYNSRSNHNDIALVKLDKALDLSDSTTKAACLPSRNENFNNLVCTVTGWGALHSGESIGWIYVNNIR